jgi:hypothetical protein
MATTPTNNKLLSEFFNFFEALPFGQIGVAIAAGGSNVPADVAVVEAVLAAAAQAFFSGQPAATVATASTLADAAGVQHVVSKIPL